MAISRFNISKQLTPKLGNGRKFKKLAKKLKKKRKKLNG
tara:strand:+ start:338 stop:454 length:117 start_codon:yes stop_codon:yes gene_type:complete